MKKQLGIWIDGSKAILVNAVNGDKQVREIPAEIENRVYHDREGDRGGFMGKQHLNHERKIDERIKQQQDRFLKQVLKSIHDEEELYILGPAEMKTKLRQKIEEEEPSLSIRSVEPAEAMTTNQLVAKVKEFFNPQ